MAWHGPYVQTYIQISRCRKFGKMCMRVRSWNGDLHSDLEKNTGEYLQVCTGRNRQERRKNISLHSVDFSSFVTLSNR